MLLTVELGVMSTKITCEDRKKTSFSCQVCSVNRGIYYAKFYVVGDKKIKNKEFKNLKKEKNASLTG